MSDSNSNPLDEYRRHLIAADQKASESFDKTVLSMSSAALGISFAFINSVVGSGPYMKPGLLFISWTSWGLSITVLITSFFFSQLALRKTIKQVDNGTIHEEKAGGVYSTLTMICNISGGLLFIIGVLSLICFVYCNLEF